MMLERLGPMGLVLNRVPRMYFFTSAAMCSCVTHLSADGRWALRNPEGLETSAQYFDSVIIVVGFE